MELHAITLGHIWLGAMLANQAEDGIEPIGDHCLVSIRFCHFDHESPALAICVVLPFGLNVTLFCSFKVFIYFFESSPLEEHQITANGDVRGQFYMVVNGPELLDRFDRANVIDAIGPLLCIGQIVE